MGTMNFNKAFGIVKDLSKSQGFYCRLLQVMQDMTQEEKNTFERDLIKNNVNDSVDLVLYFEQ